MKNSNCQTRVIDVFKEQINDLEYVVPKFKIANATIHFDESSPHLHIIGVPFKVGMKNGMQKQVGKSDVFTKESLKDIQDKMRDYCITSFNRVYGLNYTLKNKEEGRNIDINVANMNEYKKFKREKEIHNKKLKELNSKVENLKSKSNEIIKIIDELKPTIINKNNFTISSDDIEEIKSYIEQTNNTTSNLRESNEIDTILDKYEEDLKNHNNEVKNLQQKIYNRDRKINYLQEDLEDANDKIDDLENRVSMLEEALNYFKNLWKKFIEFLKDKFFKNDKYDKFIDELYEEEILNDNDIDVIQNNSIDNEKDDFER